MHPYIRNVLSPYQQNNLRMVLDVLRVHGSAIADSKIKEMQALNCIPGRHAIPSPTGSTYSGLFSTIRESFLEDVINAGNIGDFQIAISSGHGKNGSNRFSIDSSHHHGYHPPIEVVNYAKHSIISWYNNTVFNLPESSHGSYSEYEALPYLFNVEYKGLKDLFCYNNWNNFNFNEFFDKVEKFINKVIERSEEIIFNSFNSIQIVDIIDGAIKAGTNTGPVWSVQTINNIAFEVSYVKGVYQFIFNYKDIKSDHLRGLIGSIKHKGYRAKPVIFAPTKMILVKAPKLFNGDTPVYR